LSVLDNIVLGPVYAMKRKRAEVREEALALLERIGFATGRRVPDRLSADNNSAWPSYAHWRCDRRCCCSTRVTSALDPTPRR